MIPHGTMGYAELFDSGYAERLDLQLTGATTHQVEVLTSWCYDAGSSF